MGVITTLTCAACGYYCTKTTILLRLLGRCCPQLRDEAWEELKLGAVEDAQVRVEETGQNHIRRVPRKRIAVELLFIAVHNASVSLMAALAWALGSPTLALHAFCLEVAYEIFDTLSLGLQRLEPETLIHHVSPMCILCSTQTDVDFRVLCHLCVCIDLSGSILGYSKFLLRYAHVSASQIYRRLTWVHGILRVVLPLVDTTIIVSREVKVHGGLIGLSHMVQLDEGQSAFAKTDWTQLYFWAMAVLNSFNAYFFFVIRARSRMPPHVIANYEMRTGCQ